MHRRLRKGLGVTGVALFMVSLAVLPVWAHRMLVFAYLEGDQLQVESKFVGGGPVQDGVVLIRDQASGEILAKGLTDAQGRFSCPLPATARERRADLLVVVEAEMGHRGEFLLKAAQHLPGAATPAPTPAAAPTAVTSVSTSPELKLTAPELEAVMDRVLARQLTPIKEMLAASQVRPITLPDIIGGLGYIFGLCGLWAYFLSRKKS